MDNVVRAEPLPEGVLPPACHVLSRGGRSSTLDFPAVTQGAELDSEIEEEGEESDEEGPLPASYGRLGRASDVGRMVSRGRSGSG